MNTPASGPTAQNAWLPLAHSDWTPAAARHLLRRVGWSAAEPDVTRAIAEGLPRTLERLFPAKPTTWPKPEKISALEAEIEKQLPALRDSREDGQKPEARKLRNELRARSRDALQALSIEWLQMASAADRAPFEKWVLFLSDVYVTAEQKVKQAGLIYQHFDILRQHALGAAPILTKAVSRSPAMIVYLDLQGSKSSAPNENFARELFELFVLGEGHYTESDIKEAARAFTGYRQRLGEFLFQRRQADDGVKTIFGERGRFDGDAVIDLAYQQPAAASFLPGEMARFYLTSDGLPPDLLESLGQKWREQHFNLRALALTFFGSRAFFDPAWQGNYIKSPVQFYLGLLQDLDLSVMPTPRLTLNALRGMGQSLFDPPNVRGWVGGRHWINSSTLAVRQQTVTLLVDGIPDRLLNADDLAAMSRARSAGYGPFTVPDDWIVAYGTGQPAEVARSWTDQFLAASAPPAAVTALGSLLSDPSVEAARVALQTLLQTPNYNLC